jgi:NADPH:quinone reductase-like Zn-dependent oxidoreductase
MPSQIRAVRFDAFGGPEQLTFDTLPQLEPGPLQVRIHVKAASLNPIDSKIRKGTMTWMSGKKFPKRVGFDASGVVEAVGSNVTDLEKGDRVLAFVDPARGAFAESVLADVKSVVKLPSHVGFESAAAGVVIVTALQALRAAPLERGASVLVTGASGGVGLFVVQLAKARGLRVTATGSADGVELIRRFGAEEAYDYRTSPSLSGPFDAIFDFGSAFTFDRAKPLLTPSGCWVDPTPTPQRLVAQLVLNPFRRKKYRPLMTRPLPADLAEAVRLLSESISAVVAKTFPMSQVVDAYRFLEKGGVVGRVVVTTNHTESR